MSPITEEELDRLADYCAGLLDPAQHAEIDRLIATDPRWSQAHAALTSAQPLVERALADLPPESVPADVAARLDRALAREASAAGTGAVVVDLERARLWRRAAVATTAVAAAVAVCFGGFTLLQSQGTSNSAGSAAGGGKAAVAPQAGSGFAESLVAHASGTNYTHETLGRPLADSRQDAPNAAVPLPSHQAGAMNAHDTAAVPPELIRLTDPAQLQTCLNMIVTVEGGRVASVDLARYQGAPAVVVLLAAGRVTAVAARPDCGLLGSGAAIIDTAP